MPENPFLRGNLYGPEQETYAGGGEAPDQARAVNPNTNREVESEDLPEIRLTEVLKTEAPINKVENKTRKVIFVEPVGDYTMVGVEGRKSIAIYDKNGKEVEDFSSISSTEIDMSAALAKIVQKAGKAYLQGSDSGDNSDFLIENLPTGILKEYGRKIINPQGTRTFIALTSLMAAQQKHDLAPGVNISFMVEGKYVVLQPPVKNLFLVFQTKSDQGLELPPRNWKRLELTDPAKDAPEDLKPGIQKLESTAEKGGHIRELDNGYAARISGDKVEILQAGNLGAPPVFEDRIVGLGNNLAIDPNNSNKIYYCRSQNAVEMISLDLQGDPQNWQTESATFPKPQQSVKNLQFDPKGNFFLFYSDYGLEILKSDTLQEVKRLGQLSEANFDSDGRIRAVDEKGHLVIYQTNFDEVAKDFDKKRIAKLASGINITSIFSRQKAVTQKNETSVGLEYLDSIRAEYMRQLSLELAAVTSLRQAFDMKEGLADLSLELGKQGLKGQEVQYIVDELEATITGKQKELANLEADQIFDMVNAKISGSLSLAQIGDARIELGQLKQVEPLLDEQARKKYQSIQAELSKQSAELFRVRGAEIIHDVQGLVETVNVQLAQLTNKNDFDTWLDTKLPQLKARLGSLYSDCPPEAAEASKAILDARNRIQNMATEYDTKFKQEYAKIRQVAAEKQDALRANLTQDIIGLINRLRQKGFKIRKEAENYLSNLPAREALEGEITVMGSQNPDMAKELERLLKSQISNVLSEIERGSLVEIAETGQQMVLFGKTAVPKWEAKVKEKVERKVDMTFQEDLKSHGPGIRPKNLFGEVELIITNTHGKKEKVGLYDDKDDRDEWRLGLLNYRGQEIPPSYITAGDFTKIKKQYAAWESGRLRNSYEALKRQLSSIYERRARVGKRDRQTDNAWKQEYQAKLEEYAKFCAENHIALFRRIDQVINTPEIDTNGKGYVPEWQAHWVVDADTEKSLEDMALFFKMQSDLQEGVLNLKGHAGTGKDVLIKMFCNRTNRPYFGIDCTKWTTEFELAEDVILEARDGATQTVKVPSAVLNGIQTPGSVVYFNEVNGMPEQAQIFLHALWDEKRTLTLKTSSGKSIKADPSVLFASSMNPGYPGTFAPQFATRSRMVSQEVKYIPLLRENDPNDRNPNKPYNASEALRLAREMDDLEDLTFEPNMQENGFVKMWDSYVNRINNGSPQPNQAQQFEIKTVLALLTFADKLRTDFILINDKSRAARTALPVQQPLTARELRRCAYTLSKMSTQEKISADPNVTARELLDRFFLSNIDNSEDVQKVRTAMGTWKAELRVAA